MQVIAFFFEYLQRERFAGTGALLLSGDATFLLANLGEWRLDSHAMQTEELQLRMLEAQWPLCTYAP